jgi:hypothetical protein
MSHRPSRRFNPTWWTAYLVPALLIILVLALVATLVIIFIR